MLTRKRPATSPRPSASLPIALFLLANLNSLACGFVYDDFPLIVHDTNVHQPSITRIWSTPYWSDREEKTLYRPVTKTVWALLWASGNGSPLVFHLVNLLLGSMVIALLIRFLTAAGVDATRAWTAAMLFALFPIHTEATTSVVGSAELLAALFSLAALLAHRRGSRKLSLAWFVVAVLSKESAAAVAAVALWLEWRRENRASRRVVVDAAVAAAVVSAVLAVHHLIRPGTGEISPIENPMIQQSPGWRAASALWVQGLYLARIIVPLSLSANYATDEIPLITSMADPRLWVIGISLIALAVLLRRASWEVRWGSAAYAILFLPAANLLFPIGTMMGERLAYLPSAGVALAMSSALVSLPGRRLARATVVVLTIAYGLRSAIRNRDWISPEVFHKRMTETSPRSAKAHYGLGVFRSSEGDDRGAVAAYDQALLIAPCYYEAWHNRGNALARTGRVGEAVRSYQAAIACNPADRISRQNLQLLSAPAPPVVPGPAIRRP